MYSQKTMDTLQIAQNLVYGGQYTEGVLLLKAYEVGHPENSTAHIAHAIALFQLKQFEDAIILLKNYCKKYPKQNDALFQLGQLYYWTGNIAEADKSLKNYTQRDKNNAEAYLILGTLAYWQLDFDKSESYLKISDKLNPQKPDARYLMMAINDIKAPWLTTHLSISQDTQPINTAYLSVESGKYFSALLNPSVKFQGIHYALDSGRGRAFSGQIANSFSYKNTKLSVGLGLFELPFGSGLAPTAFAFLNQKLVKNLHFEGKYERKPYLLARGSFDAKVVPHTFEGALEWQKPNSWQVRTGAIGQQFNDGNLLKTVFAWAMLPPLSYSGIKLQLGYAVSYADSKFSTLTPRFDTLYIKTHYANDTTIRGFYKNYFTPELQQTHSAITSLEIKPSKKFSITLKYTYGFYATAQNPYIFLKKDSQNALLTGINFYTEKYHPADLDISATYQFSKKAGLAAHYQLSNTLFYKGQTAQIALKTKF